MFYLVRPLVIYKICAGFYKTFCFKGDKRAFFLLCLNVKKILHCPLLKEIEYNLYNKSVNIIKDI